MRCSKSPSRCPSSVSLGRRLRTLTCGHGSSGRPGRSHCMPSRTGTARTSATGSATFLPSRRPKCPVPRRILSSLAQTCTPGARLTNRLSARPGSASMRGFHVVSALGGPNRRPRRRSKEDRSQPGYLDAGDDGGGGNVPGKPCAELILASHGSEVTVSLVAGSDRTATEQTLNSFLRCCADLSRVGRFVVLDAGMSAEDRATLLERYPFLEFNDSVRDTAYGRARATAR